MDTGTGHVLEHDERSPAAARRRVAEACAGLPEDLVDTATLLTSELVTNAVQHGVGRVVLVLQRSEDEISVEVRDDGGASPRPCTSDPDAEHGRGLALLDALATHWSASADGNGTGTRVRFSLSSAATPVG